MIQRNTAYIEKSYSLQVTGYFLSLQQVTVGTNFRNPEHSQKTRSNAVKYLTLRTKTEEMGQKGDSRQF